MNLRVLAEASNWVRGVGGIRGVSHFRFEFLAPPAEPYCSVEPQRAVGPDVGEPDVGEIAQEDSKTESPEVMPGLEDTESGPNGFVRRDPNRRQQQTV